MIREFAWRLLLGAVCLAAILASGYPAWVPPLNAQAEAAGTGIVLLALASLLRRSSVSGHTRSTERIPGVLQQGLATRAK